MGIVCSPLKKKFKASANAGAFCVLGSLRRAFFISDPG
nr:MAG TPA: hypothetical protein [Caudoviricetes sp.]